MITFNGIGLENVVYFKKAHALLNKNPITFVRGANLDADPANPTGNGSGKSLFFGAIPTVAYASPPTSTKKKAKKEILSKNSKIDIDCIGADGHKYKVTQTASKYIILKDGVDIQIRTTPLAESYIREFIFPLTEIEYYTHGYLSTLRPFLMRSDTDANRLEHFSSIFRLNNYDGIRAHFSKQIRGIKDNEIRLSVLEQKSVTLKAKLKKVKSSAVGNDLSKVRSEHKALDAKIQVSVQTEFGLLKTQQVLKTLVTIEKELDELRAKYKYSDHPKKRLAILKEQKALAKKWESYNSLLKAYNKSVKSTQEKLDGLELPKESKDKVNEFLTLHKGTHEAIETELEELEEQKDEYDRLLKKAKPIAEELESNHGIKKGDKVDLKIDHQPEIEALRAQLRLQKLLNHDHLDGNNCPTCMSEVDIANIKKVVDKAKKDLPKLEKKKEAQDLYRKLKELRSKISEIKFDQAKFDDLTKKAVKYKKKVEEGREQIKVWNRYEELKAVLSDIEKPKAPKEKPDTEMSYEDLDEHIDLCNEILSHVASKTKLLENNPSMTEYRSVKAVKAEIDATQSTLDKLNKSLDTDRKRLGELNDVIEKQAAHKSEFDLYTKELAEVKAEIEKLRPSLDDKKVLEVLLKAYSSKGLKTIVANNICSVLETNLNHYRHLIFAEPFSFGISASDTGLSIRVDRGNGVESDVRNLSGAESNCFALLFLIALLPLIPEERRLNMVVLDEPSAHMDSVSRQIFVERYLPALMEVVPNIYIITPNDEYINGSSEWIVRKSRGVATLITEPHKDLSSIKDLATAVINKMKKPSTKTEKTKSKPKAKAKAAKN